MNTIINVFLPTLGWLETHIFMYLGIVFLRSLDTHKTSCYEQIPIGVGNTWSIQQKMGKNLLYYTRVVLGKGGIHVSTWGSSK